AAGEAGGRRGRKASDGTASAAGASRGPGYPLRGFRDDRVGGAVDALDPAGDLHHHLLVALHEGREGAARFVEDADLGEALEDLFPDDLQLQFGHAVADAAVDAEAERQ